MTRQSRFCDGVHRRDLLKVGVAGLFGMGLGLPEILQLQAAAPPTKRRDVSLIYVFLHGGVSTIDTFDMKPDAPAEFRGEFKPIRSSVPGLDVCEHLPRVSKEMHRLSLVRSFRHHNSDHGAADHYMLTGYFPGAGFNPTVVPNNQRPAFGSIVAKKLGPRGSVPPYVCLPKHHPSFGSAYLGAAAAPFVIDADPNAPDFAVPDVVPPLSLPAKRLADRKRILAEVDRFRGSAEVMANPHAQTVSVFQKKAFDLMSSPAARKAFDIHAEPDRLRDAYGRNTPGQSCLMARRLVEAGVRCVTIDHSNWDTHDSTFATLKGNLLPWFDAGVSTLFADLADRGLLDSTLVVITGEFGRTPRINKNAGRDHWGPAFTVALGGGGIKGGVVVGKSDPRAEKPASDPYGPEDLAATICSLMGIDSKDEFHTPDGRPIAIVSGGRVMRELV